MKYWRDSIPNGVTFNMLSSTECNYDHEECYKGVRYIHNHRVSDRLNSQAKQENEDRKLEVYSGPLVLSRLLQAV